MFRQIAPLLRIVKTYGVLSAFVAIGFISLMLLVEIQTSDMKHAHYVEKIVYKTKENSLLVEPENLYMMKGENSYWKEWKTFSHEDPSGKDKFVIFDSEDYSGRLEFLNAVPKGWSVLVVNYNEASSQMDTCSNCLTLSKCPEALDILENIKAIRDGRGGGSDDNGSDGGNGSGSDRTVELHTSALTKMAAIVFATESNAPWIYVTNKRSPIPFDTLTRVIAEHPEKGMVYNGSKRIFQPCGHFMDPFTWNGKRLTKDQDRYVLMSLPAASLYQIVDRCYKYGMDAEWQTYLDLHAPIPFVMPGTWAALDFQNVLVPQAASWALVASITSKPATTTKSSTSTQKTGARFSSSSAKSTTTTTTTSTSSSPIIVDAILSLIVQRLLWETDHVIGFVPEVTESHSYNSISTNCPTCDVENSMSGILNQHRKGHTTVDALINNWSWCSGRFHNIVDCLEKTLGNGILTGLMDQLQNHEDDEGVNLLKYLENLISVWVKLFKGRGIQTSERTPLNRDILASKTVGNSIYFTPAKSLHNADRHGVSHPPNVFRNVCARNGKKYSGHIPKRHPKTFDDVVLVVSFNFPTFLTSIVYLEFMFGRHFKHIVYCATGVEMFEEKYLKTHIENPVSFIDVNITDGYYGHHCAVAASEMNYYNVSGYLYLSDDVILNVWNLYNYPFHLPWFQTDIRIVNLGNAFARGHAYGEDWYPWNKPTGKPAIKKSINLLESLTDDITSGPRVRWFLRNLRQMASGCDNCIAYMDADLFYLPSYMASDFRFFVPYFQGVFQELSVPTILAGITPRADLHIYRLRGSFLVGRFKRLRFEKAWSPEEVFVHPVKYSAINMNNTAPRAKHFFCNILRLSDEDLVWSQHDLKRL